MVDLDFDEINQNLEGLSDKIQTRVYGVMEMSAPVVQGYAQQNASWTDRTGNARQGLTARAYREVGRTGIVLFHTMPYGVWLETAMGGQYQIIAPTISVQGRMVMQAIQGLMSKL